jgi:hypothetical protein
MSSRNFHALLVEGVPGIGKSTLIDALIRRHVANAGVRKIRAFVHLPQTYTYGPLARGEDAGTLTLSDNLALLERIVRTIEWLQADLEHSDMPCFILIDGLHLTHCLRPGVLTWQGAQEFDRRLAACCRLLLLTGAEPTIRSRLIDGRADSQFLEYAAKFGDNSEKLLGHFLHEQRQFVQMYEQSTMPKLSLLNDGRLEDIVDVAFSFWRTET